MLKTKYSNKPPDLVLPVYGPAIEFTLDNRETIFPNVPIVFCSASPKLAEQADAQPNTTGVAFRLDFAGTVATARHLHPEIQAHHDTDRHFVLRLALKRSANEAILTMKTGMEIEFVEGLPKRQLLEK